MNTGDRVTMLACIAENVDPALYVEGVVVSTTENTATIAWDDNPHEQIAFWKHELALAPTDADHQEGTHA